MIKSRPSYVPKIGEAKVRLTTATLKHMVAGPDKYRPKCDNGAADCTVTLLPTHVNCPACLKMMHEDCSPMEAIVAWDHYWAAYEQDNNMTGMR